MYVDWNCEENLKAKINIIFNNDRSNLIKKFSYTIVSLILDQQK